MNPYWSRLIQRAYVLGFMSTPTTREPSSGGIGSMLKTPSTTLTMKAARKTSYVCPVAFILIGKRQRSARTKFVAGPAAATMAIPSRG